MRGTFNPTAATYERQERRKVVPAAVRLGNSASRPARRLHLWRVMQHDHMIFQRYRANESKLWT